MEDESGQPPVREGLPPTYRMRADPHYVDLLASRSAGGRDQLLLVDAIDAPGVADSAAITALVESIRRYGVLQPLLVQERDGRHRLIAGSKRLAAAIAAGLREVPCLIFDVDDEKAARLSEAADVGSQAATREEPADAAPQTLADTALHAGSDLTQSFAALTAATDLLSGSPSELSRSVAANLVRAEVWRASTLLHATRVLRQELAIARTPVSISAVLAAVVQGFLPEARVRGITVDARSAMPHGAFMAGDERLLVGALSSAVLATVSVIAGISNARLAIAATPDDSGSVIFAVSQETVAVPESWAARAFDPGWLDRPGGVPALVSMLAVRQAAIVHGGTATAAAATAGGTMIAMTVPVGI